MRLAIIPARGGSKRIPLKNIKFFGGLPMIAWSIQAALDSKCFDRVIVSTDDDDIAAIARSFGAEVPFMRPSELSNDYIGTIPVIAHAIEWLKQSGVDPKEVCCIYATAPFLHPNDLQRGLQILKDTHAEYAFSVTSYAFPIQRAIRITSNNRVEMYQPENFNSRSQDLEEAWHDAGQFYWGKADAWIAQTPLFSRQSSIVPIPRFRVQDIDTLEDWERAEWMFRAMKHAQLELKV